MDIFTGTNRNDTFTASRAVDPTKGSAILPTLKRVCWRCGFTIYVIHSYLTASTNRLAFNRSPSFSVMRRYQSRPGTDIYGRKPLLAAVETSASETEADWGQVQTAKAGKHLALVGA